MLLLKEPANDKLSFILFDIPKTIENAKKVLIFFPLVFTDPD
jgi:hypothetical protein